VDIGWWEYPTFSLVPLWNERGKADSAYFVAGQSPFCPDPQHANRCVMLRFAAAWDALAYQDWSTYPLSFQGSLLEDKRDKTGTWYRRNRNYDPGTGRFTQEDPIGLAGGMNLYGFASGDPVNFSDPFGLCPDPKKPACTRPGLIVSGGVGGYASSENGGGRNAQWGFALNLNSGDATIFQTTGTSSGSSGNVGPFFSWQNGSLNDLVSPTGSGGGRSATASVPGFEGGAMFDDAGKPVGGTLGVGGIGLGAAIHESDGGNTLGTINLYSISSSYKAVASELRRVAKDAVQAMNCPNGCRR
jgi:RHS repeat-associated protein